MPDIMAIISKAVFEKSSPNAKVGAVLPLRTYNSASKHLERLSSDKNSRLFLVTVRPPNEALWLVAVLESLEEDDGAWRASKRNRYPITDVSALRGQLKFESGTGIQAKPGALGMSLQTPRVLTPSDAALLLPVLVEKPIRKRPPGPVHVNQHEPSLSLPCLCYRCIEAAPQTLERDGIKFFRSTAEAQERILWFWTPEQLRPELPELVKSIQASMLKKLRPIRKPKKGKAAAAATREESDD